MIKRRIYIICLVSAFWASTSFLAGCGGRMSLQEARQVTVSMQDKAFIPPPRRISDVLSVLDVKVKQDSAIRQLIRDADRPVPDKADDETLAIFYRERGEAAWNLGRWKQVNEDLREALKYSEKIGFANAIVMGKLAWIERGLGNYRYAVELLERSEKLKNSMFVYPMLVEIYLQLGDFDAAARAKNKGTELCNMIISRQPQHVWANAFIAWMESMLLDSQGRFREAEDYHRQEIAWRKKAAETSGPVTRSRQRLIHNLVSQGRLIEAEYEARLAIREALEIEGAESINVGNALQSMAEVMLAAGRLADAEKLTNAGINIKQRAGLSDDCGSMGSSRMFLGNILAAQHDYENAMKQYDLSRESLKENRYLYEKLFTRNRNLILALIKNGRIDEAQRNIKNAYALEEKRDGGRLTTGKAEVLGLEAAAYTTANNYPKAFGIYSRVVPVLLRRFMDLRTAFVQRERIKAVLEIYLAALEKIQGSALEKSMDIRASRASFRIANAMAAQSTQGAIGESAARAAAAYDPELSDLVRREQDIRKQISSMRASLSDLMSAPPDQQNASSAVKVEENIDNLNRAGDAILEEINKRFPRYADFVNPKPVSLSEVQKALRPGEALISIYTAEDKTYIWAAAQTGEAVFSSAPISKKESKRIVSGLRKSLDSHPRTFGDIPDFDSDLAGRLYDSLLKPVEAGWKDAKYLLTVTPGPLGQLPLALLLTSPVKPKTDRELLFDKYHDLPWLIRKVSLTSVPSINALVSLRAVPGGDPQRKPFIGFGDPVFSPKQLEQPVAAKKGDAPKTSRLASRGLSVTVRGVRISEKGMLDSMKIDSSLLSQLERLPDTSEEIISTARALEADQQKDVFLGRNASEHQVKNILLSDRKVVSFATHALVPGDLDGLDQPALALSSPSVTGEKEDGLLTMGEILKLKMNADWVVLSACNTGAAEGQGAEAISGLGKAFFYAGTRSLLVTMWPVETTSAKKLVTDTFHAQKDNRNLSRAQALRKAALDMIDRGVLKDRASGRTAAAYAHPLFWAPFVLVGDPGNAGVK